MERLGSETLMFAVTATFAKVTGLVILRRKGDRNDMCASEEWCKVCGLRDGGGRANFHTVDEMEHNVV